MAVGGLEPPHWPEKYTKYRVFSTFEADFCPKSENKPSPKAIGVRVGEEPELMWSRTSGSRFT